MDLDLKQIGQTVAVGGFVIYSIILLRKLYRPKWTNTLFRFSHDKWHLPEAAVAIALVFAVGIVIEAVSKDITSGRHAIIGNSFDRILKSDKELRLRSLFEINYLSTDRADINEGDILIEILNLAPPSNTTKEKINELKLLIESNRKDKRRIYVEEENYKTLIAGIGQIYYTAKNSVYETPTYFSELNEIESRANFTRSLTFLCIIFFVTYLLFGLISFVPYVSKRFGFTPKRRVSLFGTCLLFLIGIFLTGMAYELTCTNYNMRVFGYYISQTKNKSLKLSEK